MLNLFWRGVARIVSKPKVADLLIRRAMKTPFSHLPSNENPSYMERYWLFNAYPESSQDRKRWQFPWSIRLHMIKRADAERDMHDHPWNARTIILRGAYREKRFADEAVKAMIDHPEGSTLDWSKAEVFEYFDRKPGNTAKIQHNEYHTITDVSEGGVWTMFISGPWLGDWGFLRNGVKVWWRTYLKDKEEAEARKSNLNKAYGKFGSKDNVLYWTGREEDLVAKALDLGPLAKLRDLDEVEEGFFDLSSPRGFATGGFVRPLAEGELVPEILSRELLIPVKQVDETIRQPGELTHEDANALTRVLLCPKCQNGCPHCDPEMRFNWGEVK